MNKPFVNVFDHKNLVFDLAVAMKDVYIAEDVALSFFMFYCYS